MLNKIKNNYNFTIYASYLGGITQAIIVNLITLLFLIFMEEFGIPLGKITVLITVNFLVQLSVDFLAAKFVDRIGYRRCIVAAHVLAAVGLISMATLPYVLGDAFIALLFSVILYAVGGGLIEVLVSPIVEACPTDNKASVMSLLHSFYCWGTVAVIFLSTMFFKFFGTEKWYILVCLWAIVPLFNVILFTNVPIASLTKDGEGMKLRELLSHKTFLLFILLLLTAGASEVSMSQWASAFAESALGVSKTVGDLAGPCVFAIMMGIARVFYSKKGDKINLLMFLIVSGCVSAISYFIAAFSPYPFLALMSCGLCGLSVGMLWPGILSIASVKYPRGGTAMFAILALSGDLGCSVGPTLVGAVSEAIGGNLKVGMLFGAIFPIGFVICALIYKMTSRRSKK